MSWTGAITGAGGGATLLGFATRLLAADAVLAGALFGAAFFAFLATFTGLLVLVDARAFFLATLLLAAVRFAFATGRFFPLAFFFAMISLLLGSYGSSMRE
jgi:hypothetical protein